MENLTTVTTKGQVTIPIQFRLKLGLNTGSKVKFSFHSDKKRVLTLEPVPDFSSLQGYFKTGKKYSKPEARKAFIKDVLQGKV